MFNYRKFDDNDIEFVMNNDFILGLQIQYDGDFDKDNSIVVYDDDANIVGVGALEYHSSWYSNKKAGDKCINFCYCIVPHDKYSDILVCLLNGIKERIEYIKKCNADKNVVLINFQEATEIQETQLMLNNGFCYGKVIPVLKLDTMKEIKVATLPKSIEIKELKDDDIEKYIEATGEANDGESDSINEYYFRKNDENFMSFAAYDGDTIVGGISIWNIGEDRAATENIFVVPDYQRKGIATALIQKASDAIKSRGISQATLSMLGDNARAMRLYQKVGYELMYYLVNLEMR